MLIISYLLFFIFHPFYVSVTDISYHQKTKNFEISSKIFFDDFEKCLEKEYHLSIDVIHPKDKSKLNNYINKYFNQHLKININGQSKNLRYIGYEINDDAVWCYFEVDGISKINEIEINNNLLLKIHPEQINILNVRINSNQRNVKLSSDNTSFTWKNPTS